MSRRVAVVGAGIAGVATAYELAALGLEVQVFERCGSVAEQASFACNALLAPFAPGLQPPPAAAPLGWRWRRWRAGRQGDGGAAALAALSLLGIERVATLRHELGLDDEAATGLLVALTDARHAAAAEAQLEGWRSLGLQVELLDGSEARRREPGLGAEAPLAAALAFARGGTGNARLFAQQLRQRARRLGVGFRFHTTVSAVATEGASLLVRHEYTAPPDAPTRAPGGERDAGDTVPQPPGPQQERFDAVVLCNGLDAGALCGRRLPLAAQFETSVTAPLRVIEAHPELGPQAGWVDPAQGLAIARIGQRVRVTGGLAITTGQGRARPDYEALHRGLQHWFPGSVLHQQLQQGQSRRALAADGLPVLGASGMPGVWLNLSPGGLGWGLACGGALALALQLAGQASDIDISSLGPQRLA